MLWVRYHFNLSLSLRFDILGATHEQNRSDRDSHVKINFNNIKEGKADNFQKKSSGFSSRGTPYDYARYNQYKS